MNDPNKRIDVNISSLFSLKAELMRKQEEVAEAKLKQASQAFVPKKPTKREKKDKASVIESAEPEIQSGDYIEIEDSALLEKSKRVLKAKAKFYDKMTASGGKLNSDDNCLVMFNHKKQDEIVPSSKASDNSSSSNSDSSDSDEDSDPDKYKAKNDDEEWVEYTDCFGRSRQCLRKDLEVFKKRDQQVADDVQPRIEINQNAPMWCIDTQGDKRDISLTEIPDCDTDMASMMSKHEQMRMDWERKEQENAAKENIHYQDVLFDEARSHGVGYYAFATDADERAEQLKALDKLRDETLDVQKSREEFKVKREKIIADRVKAARNRLRAREGLPPLEDEPEKPPEPLYNTKEEEKRKKKEEKAKRKKEKEEKLREEERKNHIRPWDQDKDGVQKLDTADTRKPEEKWRYKPERLPMSQEQWNEVKRAERKPEFAPVPESERPIRDFRSNYTENQEEYSVDPASSLFFTTKKQNSNKEFLKRNLNSLNSEELATESIPIRNELSEDEDERTNSHRKGVEIAPPPTFDYYGPSLSKRSKNPPKQNIETAIEAGLRFLREKSDKGILPTKSSWTANADY